MLCDVTCNYKDKVSQMLSIFLIAGVQYVKQFNPFTIAVVARCSETIDFILFGLPHDMQLISHLLRYYVEKETASALFMITFKYYIKAKKQ